MTTTKTIHLGRLLATPGVIEGVEREDVIRALMRHQKGDWGDCGQEDRRTNDEALKEGGRLFSVYRDTNGTKFWIITEADRSATTILLPDEY